MNLPMALTFRCPAHFPGPKDASEFCPERFLGKSDDASTCSRSHTAFGAQRRMCVGFTFALAELLAITVCMMRRRFDVELFHDDEKGPMKIEAGVNQPDGTLQVFVLREESSETNCCFCVIKIDQSIQSQFRVIIHRDVCKKIS